MIVAREDDNKIQRARVYRTGISPDEWVKATANLTLQIAGLRRDGHLEIYKTTFGISLQEYDQTTSHSFSSKEEKSESGSTVDKFSIQQKRVIDSLVPLEIVSHLYFYNYEGTDFFTVVLTKDDLETKKKLANLYWALFDNDPKYHFEFKPIPADCFSEDVLAGTNYICIK